MFLVAPGLGQQLAHLVITKVCGTQAGRCLWSRPRRLLNVLEELVYSQSRAAAFTR